MSIYSERIRKMRYYIFAPNEAMLFTKDENIYYFTGMRHSEGSLLITEKKAYLFVDFRYAEAAEKTVSSAQVINSVERDKDICKVCVENGVTLLSLEARETNVLQYNRFTELFTKRHSIKLECDGGFDMAIANNRMIKTPDEIEKMQTAQNITEKALTEVLNDLKPGVTERSIAIRLEYLMKLYGAEDISFDLITITGENTSLPHGVPGDRVVKDGDFFTFDIGAVYEGYHSDMTRTFGIGHINEKQRQVYDIVLKAQKAALDTIKDSVFANQVDAAARDIIKDAGYGDYFGHVVGHGVGLEIHEAPTVSPRSTKLLSPGMVITDEPGIYIPGEFGVRIEDMVLVEHGGYKNFASFTKDLIVI